MKRILAVSLSQGLRQTRVGGWSALFILGSNLLPLNLAWADNAASTSASTGTVSSVLSANTAAAAAATSALPASSSSVFTMLFGLVAVLALMAGIAWLLKRFGVTQNLAGHTPARIIGGVSVGTRERVMVIEVGEQWIVVGVAPGRVNALTTMPRQELPAQQEMKSGAPAFSSWLKQTMDKRNGGAPNGSRPRNDGSTT